MGRGEPQCNNHPKTIVIERLKHLKLNISIIEYLNSSITNELTYGKIISKSSNKKECLSPSFDGEKRT